MSVGRNSGVENVLSFSAWGRSHARCWIFPSGFEIREYYESMNISYHDSFSDSYFQYLANYIFGGNYNNEKISGKSSKHVAQVKFRPMDIAVVLISKFRNNQSFY